MSRAVKLLLSIDRFLLWLIATVVLASLLPARGAATGWVDPVLLSGMLYLTLLPSTVQSSIAFTAMARGNVAAAVCSASLSNLLGIFLTPLLVGVFLHVAGAGAVASSHSIGTIALQLLLPLLGLQVIRRPGAERTLFRFAAMLEERGLTGVSSPGGAFQGDYR
ncbi:bile acid:sodium symporter [Sphingomonas sp. PWP1-2]|uniref:bile acid:sodium symporter n=1 Tax=Sphingomonas sp. PWP1-2 TaxID=2804558 RepID=UPI003CF56B85